LKTFISNVIVQCVERHLLDHLEDIFKTSHLFNMNDQEITDLAQEDEAVRHERADLKRVVEILEKGDKICRQHMARHGMELV
jgi:hypothetical protein